jgi:hypothetical protein
VAEIILEDRVAKPNFKPTSPNQIQDCSEFQRDGPEQYGKRGEGKGERRGRSAHAPWGRSIEHRRTGREIFKRPAKPTAQHYVMKTCGGVEV